MAEWLILQLSRNPQERCGWMLADPFGQPLESPLFGSLSQAAPAAHGRRVAAIVPSADVLTTEVELPVRSGVRTTQLVAYALEEQLAADIETLHFALGPRDEASARTPVAVVARGLVNQWLEALSAHGLTAEVVAPEATLLPENPGHVVVLLSEDTLCVRAAGQNAVALPGDDLGAALEASLGVAFINSHLIFYVTPADWQRRAAEVEALRSRCASLKAQLLNAGVLPLLSPQLAGGRFINLLSGEYAPKRASGGNLRQWRLAAILAVALFAVHVGGLSLQLWQQQRSETKLDSDIGEIARNAIAGDTGTGAVRNRIERRLLSAQALSGATGFMPALSALAQAINGVNGTAVQSLSYREGGLDLRLKARDAESLDRIDRSLRERGWQAELTSGARTAGAYEGRIQIRPPGTASGSTRKP